MSSEPLLLTREQQWELLGTSNFHAKERDPVNTNCDLEFKMELVEGGWRQTWIVQWGRRRILDPFIVIIRRTFFAAIYLDFDCMDK